jgi:hypothetical protein
MQYEYINKPCYILEELFFSITPEASLMLKTAP